MPGVGVATLVASIDSAVALHDEVGVGFIVSGTVAGGSGHHVTAPSSECSG